MAMGRAVCLKCNLMFKAKKSGRAIEEGMPDGNGGFQSYKLWMGDVLRCEGCGSEIMVGFGLEPIAEHYQPNYQKALEVYKPISRIDDCNAPYSLARERELRGEVTA